MAREFSGRVGTPHAKSIIMEFFPSPGEIWKRAKSPKGVAVAVALLLVLLLSELIQHALYRWLNDLLAHEAGPIMNTIGSFIKWTGNNQITFILILGLIYCFFIILGAQLKWNKPKIREIRKMWPIILMGLGVSLFAIFFGIGAILFFIHQSKAIPHQPSKPEVINQGDVNIIKKQARLHLLQRDLPKFESLKEYYEKGRTGRFTQYLEPLTHPLDMESSLLSSIRSFASDFNEHIEDIYAIDTKKYDINMPFPEEDQIKDPSARYKYRKAKYEYLSGKDKLEHLLAMFKKEIDETNNFIDLYAKRNIPPF